METLATQTLQEKLAVAREASRTKVESGFDKVEGKRTEMGDALRRAAELAKQKVTEFRAWDKKTSIEVVGTVRALPEMTKIVVREGKDRVVEGAKDLLQWTKDSADKVRNIAETTIDNAIIATENAIEEVKRKGAEKRDEISDFFVETGKSISESADRGKNRLVAFWKKVRAVPHDIIGGAHERTATRIEGKIEKQKAALEAVKAKAQEHRGKADALKGTKKEVAAALA